MENIGYKGRCSYDSFDADCSEDLDLDAIHCAGSLCGKILPGLLHRMRTLGLTALIATVAFLVDPEIALTYRRQVDVDPVRKMRFTNIKYLAHLQQLVQWGVIEKIPSPERIAHFSTYFAIRKGMTNMARSIFNGKALCSLFRTPPPVNIPDVCAIIRRVGQFCTTHQRTFAIHGDLRHWFHQLPAPLCLKKFFGLACGGCFFVWKSMPMGFSFSPWVSQGVCWSFILYRELNEQCLFDETAFSSVHLPSFVNVVIKGKVRGWVTVYYDNYFVLVDDLSLAEQISARILRNARILNVQIKGMSPEDVSAGIPLSHRVSNMVEGVEYLGIRFTHLHEDRKRRRGSLFSWRLADPAAWIMKHGDDKGILQLTHNTKRKTASLFGKFMFHRWIRCEPFACSQCTLNLIEAMSRLGKAASSEGWDSPYELTTDEKSLTETLWLDVVTNPDLLWIQRASDDINPESLNFLISDASDIGMGFVGCNFKDLSISLDPTSLNFRGQEYSMYKDCHIYIKELIAAENAVTSFFAKYPDQPIVVLVVDNTAVAWALRNGYSSNALANSRIRVLGNLLSRLVLVTIPSEMNAVDHLSRASVIPLSSFQCKLDECRKAIEAHIKGCRHGSSLNAYIRDSERGLRHCAPEENIAIDPEWITHIED